MGRSTFDAHHADPQQSHVLQVKRLLQTAHVEWFPPKFVDQPTDNCFSLFSTTGHHDWLG
jgi:hypothetical protein